MAIVTLLTDFGMQDSYVAEMKGAILSRAPQVSIVDITHLVPPGDIRAAQYLLSRAWGHFPLGTVHVAVVDPGVGTERRVLAATRTGQHFLAPDNGLLSFLDAGAHFVQVPVPPGAAATFHGRDVFAPAAVALVTGAPLDALGTTITQPVRAPLPLPRRVGAIVLGEIIYVDHFGTLISNLPAESVPLDARIRVAGADAGPLRRTFADVPRGELVAFVGSGGMIEVAVRDGSAAERLAVGVAASVTVGETTVQDGR